MIEYRPSWRMLPVLPSAALTNVTSIAGYSTQPRSRPGSSFSPRSLEQHNANANAGPLRPCRVCEGPGGACRGPGPPRRQWSGWRRGRGQSTPWAGRLARPRVAFPRMSGSSSGLGRAGRRPCTAPPTPPGAPWWRRPTSAPPVSQVRTWLLGWPYSSVIPARAAC
jgi:hypothetical protein